MTIYLRNRTLDPSCSQTGVVKAASHPGGGDVAAGVSAQALQLCIQRGIPQFVKRTQP